MQPSRPGPSSLETDLYQLTMAYAYWASGKHNLPASFDYFFRECPFGGEFAIFAGLEDLLDFVERFGFRDDQISYLASGPLAGCNPKFFEWLSTVNFSEHKIYSLREGSLSFPKLPLIRVDGPLAAGQLLETPLLATCNFPSLMTTNAARYRIAAGDKATLLEFGLRRAQDGLRASHYAWLGGFDSTSNVEAARRSGIRPRGTMAHSFVSSFSSLKELSSFRLVDKRDWRERDFVRTVLEYRKELGYEGTNEGELAAFIAYAQVFPRGFLALVDTYDTLISGVPNFICVALALNKFGYRSLGVRIDSGDLAKLSRATTQMFIQADNKYAINLLRTVGICASNEINERVLYALKEQSSTISMFGIGTHLSTCYEQPAFGGVYKLVELNGKPKIKLSNDQIKMTIPGRKDIYRLIGADGKAILDLITPADSVPPLAGERVLCRHPLKEAQRVFVIPSRVEKLNNLVWNGGPTIELPARGEVKAYVKSQIGLLGEDRLRVLNPAPYDVFVNDELYRKMHEMWMKQAPIPVVE